MGFRTSPDPKASLWGLIAYYLRFCRQQRGLTGEQAGQVMGYTKSTVSKLETGVMRLDAPTALKIDKAWNTGGIFSFLVHFATLGHDPDWFRQYVDFEVKAKMIRLWENEWVPGLLQTREYAMAGLTAGGIDNLEEAVEARMARQTLLTSDDPPLLWVLLDQGVIEQPVGGPEVMRTQLAWLLEASDHPKVNIRIVPRSVGAHPGMDGAFMVLSLPSGDVAYSEAAGGGRLVAVPDEVMSYVVRYERLSQEALPLGLSRDMIRQAMEAMS